MPHVVYLLGSALRPIDLGRLGMAAMRERGFQVTVLDVADICHPTISQEREHYASLEKMRPEIISDMVKFSAYRKCLAEADLIFCLVTSGIVTRRNYPILREVSQSGTPYALICSDVMPGIRNYKGELASLHKRAKDIFARRKLIDPISSLISRLPLRFLGLRPADFVIYGGEASRRRHQLVGPGTYPINAHAYDYESFIKNGGHPVAPSDTAVFLDQYLPHHRDWALLGVKTVVDTETYYPNLRLLFDRIEKELGLEVVIAAHPRADYTDKPGVFGNRRIIHGLSERLTRDCRLTITFTSLAINFAVLHRKPVLLLTTNSYYRSPAGHRYTHPMSQELGLPVIFLENAARAPLSGLLAFDDALYRQYVATYVKIPGSLERSYWTIVIEALGGKLPSFHLAQSITA